MLMVSQSISLGDCYTSHLTNWSARGHKPKPKQSTGQKVAVFPTHIANFPLGILRELKISIFLIIVSWMGVYRQMLHFWTSILRQKEHFPTTKNSGSTNERHCRRPASSTTHSCAILYDYDMSSLQWPFYLVQWVVKHYQTKENNLTASSDGVITCADMRSIPWRRLRNVF